MDTEENYRKQVYGMIKYYVRGSYWKNRMLSSDDFITDAMTAIMKADWKHDGRAGTSKRSFRMDYFINEVKCFIKNCNKAKNNSYSLEWSTTSNNQNNASYLLKNLIEDEDGDLAIKDIDLKDSLRLLPQDRQDLLYDKFFSSMTLTEMGKKRGFTKERARQVLDRAIGELAEVMS